MQYEVVIESMHCEHCASNIERYLRNQPGVGTAEMDFQAGKGRLDVDADADVTALVEAIDSMGYDASLIEPS